jgi:hypothetical protein
MSSLLKYLLVLVVLALQSCGGSSGGGSSSKTSSGFLSAAPIDNASCFIYKITTEGTKGDELTSSDSDKGIVTFSNVGYSGRALIQCSAGGTYTDEATGNEKQSPILRVALNFIEGEKFAITPLTEIAVQLDNNLNNVIDIHNDTVAKVFGLSGKSITAILPTDIDKISLTNDDSGDYAMILAMLSKLEAEDTSNDSSLSKIIDLLKTDLVDGTLEQITTGKLVAAFNGLEDKFKNTNIDKIKADVIGKPLLVDLPVKNLISDSFVTFEFSNTGGVANSCSSEPNLPSGLAVILTSGSCKISGVPTLLQDVITYTIKATNSVGYSTATVNISIDLDTPKNLTATERNIIIALTWNSVSGADKYNIHYATETFANIEVVNYSSLNGYTLLANLTGVSKEIINLIINTKYYFVITAVKDTFESSGSNEVTATPKAPVEVRMLNDTGVTWGGNAQTGNNTTCTGAVISAQDCSHGRDAKAVAGTLTKVGSGRAGFDFTKLGSTGNVLSIQNAAWVIGGTGTESAGTKWSCVRDNVTGLTWEVKTDSGSADSDTTDSTHTNIHHKNNKYRWGGKTALSRDYANRQGTHYDDWTGLVDGTNTENLCGGSNWRVPTVEELESIADLSIKNLTIDSDYFPDATAMVDKYSWSSSPSNNEYAWVLDFDYGNATGKKRDLKLFVRLVRFEQ